MKHLFLFLLWAAGWHMILAQETAFYRLDETGKARLTREGASHFAGLALSCLEQEYPNKLNQTLANESQLGSPRELHPAFYGCYDWHSSVHGCWMLVRLMRKFPGLPEEAEIRRLLNRLLSRRNLREEAEYMERESKSWERMYGWGWLLKLYEETDGWRDPDARDWANALEPLVAVIVGRLEAFLPNQAIPVRTGVHPNTAFGMAFALDYAWHAGDRKLEKLLVERAKTYYHADTGWPARWEPSGEDFLSPGLIEADLMQRIYEGGTYKRWFKRFVSRRDRDAWYEPVDVSDRADPKIVHLDGLNLSRAWCFYGIAGALNKDKDREPLLEAAREHLAASLPYVASPHYEGSHWLGTFAVYALTSYW